MRWIDPGTSRDYQNNQFPAYLVGVLDSKEEFPFIDFREEVIINSCPEASDVQVACRGGSVPDPDLCRMFMIICMIMSAYIVMIYSSFLHVEKDLVISDLLPPTLLNRIDAISTI